MQIKAPLRARVLVLAARRENNPMFGKTGKNNPNYGKPRTEGSGKPSQAIEVFDNKNNTTTSYNSMSEAAITLNINIRRISEYFINNQQKPYKARYTFKKL